MKILIILAILICMPVYADVWKDDFERKEIGDSWIPITWCKVGEGFNWQIEDGILRGRCRTWIIQMLFLHEYPLLDYTIQVKCRIDKVWEMPESAGAGIVFRCTELEGECIGSFYSFVIYESLCNFFIFNGPGNWFTANATRRKNLTGKWYLLKLVVKDSMFLGYVDDELVCSLEHSLHRGKFLGLAMGPNIDASFDDFMISDSVDKEAFKNLSVSYENKLTSLWGLIRR